MQVLPKASGHLTNSVAVTYNMRRKQNCNYELDQRFKKFDLQLNLYAMLHNDHKYIEALRNNDVLMIEQIYKLHSASIKRMVLQNNGNEMDAADLFQDVLLELHKKAMNGFQLTCPLGGFLYLMCRSRWLNEIQRRQRNRSLLKHLSHNESAATIDDHRPGKEKTAQQRELVYQMLDEMGEPNKKLLLLAFSGKPLKELANSLNFTYGYLRKKKAACMSKLVEKVRLSEKFAALRLQDL